ncbi:hypothetical protein [Microbulbifer sp. JMSA003]|uniref:hypothetical protein n=1 Tax=unclassified Microbulbifer TaxID=2619833 RepID=UPI0040391C63
MHIDRIARMYGGVKTWAFTQTTTRLRVYPWYAIHSPKGICEGLSANWVKTNALDETSLPAQLGLYPKRVKLGPFTYIRYQSLNITHLMKVAKQFKAWRATGRQSEEIKEWLIWHGLEYKLAWSDSSVDRMAANRVEIIPGQPRPALRREPPNNIALSLQLRNLYDAYAMITFGGRIKMGMFSMGAAHSVAAWLSNPNVPWRTEVGALFFDPNYGEYRFSTRDDFFRFFESYYRTAYMSGGSQYTGYWAVDAYVKRYVG